MRAEPRYCMITTCEFGCAGTHGTPAMRLHRACCFYPTRPLPRPLAPCCCKPPATSSALYKRTPTCRPASCEACCIGAGGATIADCNCTDWTKQCKEFVYQHAKITSEAIVGGKVDTNTATCTTTLTNTKTQLVKDLDEPVRFFHIELNVTRPMLG